MKKNVVSKRSLWASAVCVVILVAGFAALWYQHRAQDMNHAAAAAKQAVLQIDALLDEASLAADRSSNLLVQPCTQALRDVLNHQVIVQKHVRLITLINHNNQLCSSYSDVSYADISRGEAMFSRLVLKNGNHISPGDPLLILTSGYPQGWVATSLSAAYITDILQLLGTPWQLDLRIGGSALSAASHVTPIANPQHRAQISQSSARFPFSVGLAGAIVVPVSRFILEDLLAIALLILLAFLAGLLTYQVLFRPPAAEDELASAIESGNIIPFYQPVNFSQDGELAGVEVLARWQVPGDNCIAPDRFIPLAEQTGLIVPMTRHLMRAVARDLFPILHRLPSPFHVGINISAAHAADPGLWRDCQTFLASLTPGPVNLTLEITEREPFALTPAFRETLTGLRRSGVRIALDDFGTGYSNLGYLHELPIDFIKIDKSFISRISEEPDSALLVECVIDIAKKLELDIIAEGVETPLQRDYLKEKGITYLQGYYYSRPMPAGDFVKKYLQDV